MAEFEFYRPYKVEKFRSGYTYWYYIPSDLNPICRHILAYDELSAYAGATKKLAAYKKMAETKKKNAESRTPPEDAYVLFGVRRMHDGAYYGYYYDNSWVKKSIPYWRFNEKNRKEFIRHAEFYLERLKERANVAK